MDSPSNPNSSRDEIMKLSAILLAVFVLLVFRSFGNDKSSNEIGYDE